MIASRFSWSFFVSAAFALGSVVQAADPAPVAAAAAITPVMTVPGKMLVDVKFSGELPQGWRGVRGDWTVVDGAVRGVEIKEQHHQAVLRHPMQFKDAIISFSFRLDAARTISLSVNDAKEHVCRLVVNRTTFIVQKDDHDHDGPDKAVVFARKALKLDPAVWHTAVVEICGPEMVAQIDGREHIGFGSHELLDRPKANFGFTAAGGAAEFRDIKVWAATRRDDWATTKAAL